MQNYLYNIVTSTATPSIKQLNIPHRQNVIAG